MKRVFFGTEVIAPWPAKMPTGRIIDPSHRHITLAFLGDIPYRLLNEKLNEVPTPSWCVGVAGYFDECLCLPQRHPSVIAWHGRWLRHAPSLEGYQKELTDWLRGIGYHLDGREWLPHVTLCRKPFEQKAWRKSFERLPFYVGAVHLYESVGNLSYVPLWSFQLRHPFCEIEHTADIAFDVYGNTLSQLYDNAFIALAFKFPSFLAYYKIVSPPRSLDEVIALLNEEIARADSEEGCGLKAVCYHGEAQQLDDKTLHWEMIVDV